MRPAEVHEKIVRREGPWLWAAWALQPLAFAYGAGAVLNRLQWERGLRKPRHFDTVVVSVGNIEVGGVGKTPVTVSIAGTLAAMGLKTAVVARNLCRGKHPPVAVRPGHSSGAVPISDEPVLLSRILGSCCPVYTAASKTDAVERAVRELKPAVVVVDNGFQHHRLYRNLDVVVLSADHPFGLGGLLPAGTMREPERVLGRADYLWINGVTSQAQLSLAKRLIASRNWKAPFIASSVVPEKPVAPDGSVDRIGRVFAFCGIGKPDGFRHTLERTGFELAGFHVYPDHWNYTEKEIDHLMEKQRSTGADYLITTEKDAARLGSSMTRKMDLRVLPIRLSVLDSTAFEDMLGRILELAGEGR